MTFGRNEVHAWFLPTGQMDEPWRATAWSILSDEERSRHDAFRLDRDRHDYLAAHALLRTALSLYADVAPDQWNFQRDRYGKPRLADRHAGLNLTFNLAHTRGLVACAIAAGPAVGIDVERIDATIDWASVIERYFTDSERRQLESCVSSDRAARFAMLWTLKEAFIKATGKGLSEPLLGFGFDVSDDSIRFVPPANVDGASWRFAIFAPGPDYRMSIAVNADDPARPAILARSAAPGFISSPGAGYGPQAPLVGTS